VQRPFIEAFLKALREAILKHGLRVVSRSSNNQALIDLGLTPERREEVILNLQCENYAQGPLADDQGLPGDVWIFGCEIDGREVYVKLKIFTVQNEKYAKCLSFHPSQHSLHYPLK
jgi:hypothetical protein